MRTVGKVVLAIFGALIWIAGMVVGPYFVFEDKADLGHLIVPLQVLMMVSLLCMVGFFTLINIALWREIRREPVAK